MFKKYSWAILYLIIFFGVCLPIQGNQLYKVKKGDTLAVIAKNHYCTVEELSKKNNIENPDKIFVGQELSVPTSYTTYIIQKGDTLSQLAVKFKIDFADLVTINKIENANLIYPGQRLIIPFAGNLVRGNPSRDLYFIWPTQGFISSPYGERGNGFHAGIDIANKIGTPIRAAQSGEVTYSANTAGYGLLVVIQHEQDYSTYYAHNLRNIVKGGQKVKRGQIIAFMGSTGISTGPHLHFEIRRNGIATNPIQLLPPTSDLSK